MNRFVIINAVGLNLDVLRHMPKTTQWSEKQIGGPLKHGPFPGLTTTAQVCYITGKSAQHHGIVGNGWYDRNLAEVLMWKQPEHLINTQEREKLWDHLRQKLGKNFTCAKIFWWYNMCSSADWTITPRPLYPADGRKVFDIHTKPMKMREEIKADLGPLPFANFWGPMSGIPSTRWIADCARWIENHHQPTLSLVYLPHLDYILQQQGPNGKDVPKEAQKLDEVLSNLIEFYEEKGISVILLSEYGIEEVHTPIMINQEFRKKGWIEVKDELGRETLFCDGSKAFALCDHQIAHVYLSPLITSEEKTEVKKFLEKLPGIERIIEPEKEWEKGIGRQRAGDFILEAKQGFWFAYYFWLDDKKAPDFAHCVDIFRKTGYDPCELFFRYKNPLRTFHLAGKLFKIKAGMRTLMDIIPLKPELVKGSHGRSGMPENFQPVCFGISANAWSEVYPALIKKITANA